MIRRRHRFDSDSEVGWFPKINKKTDWSDEILALIFYSTRFPTRRYPTRSSPRAIAGQGCSNWLDIQRLKVVMMDCLLATIHWNYRPNKEEQDWGVRLTIEADENLVVIDFIDGWYPIPIKQATATLWVYRKAERKAIGGWRMLFPPTHRAGHEQPYL